MKNKEFFTWDDTLLLLSHFDSVFHRYVHEAKVYMLLYLMPIHRVFKPNTLCICMKYTVYLREIQNTYDYFSISFPSLSNAFQME